MRDAGRIFLISLVNEKEADNNLIGVIMFINFVVKIKFARVDPKMVDNLSDFVKFGYIFIGVALRG